MTFPSTALPVTVELSLNGTWTDVTTYVYSRDNIVIKRGRSDEAQNIDPSTCRLTLDNRTGRFSPRNPSGAYYGNIGRNTPLRVSVTGLDDNALHTTTSTSAYATTPTAAALNTASDIDVRVELNPSDLYSASADLMGKWDDSSNQRGWVFWHDSSGTIYLSWSTAGTAATQIDVASTVPLRLGNSRRYAVRATLKANNGASGYTVTFYWSDSLTGTWSQLGSAVVGASTTSVFACTAALRLAKAVSSGTGRAFVGNVYKAAYYTGSLASGTLAANPDFTAQTAGATSFTDSATRVWTVNSPAAISSSSVRFSGEVSQWPVKWDPTGADVYVPIEAAGILRRLQANPPPLKSTMFRGVVSLGLSGGALKAYWPLEDESAATSFAAAMAGIGTGSPAAISGSPSLSSFTGFIASKSLPTFGGLSYMTGAVAPYTNTNAFQVRTFMYVPATGTPTNDSTLLQVKSTTLTWRLLYQTTTGNIKVTGTDADGTSIFSTVIALGAGAIPGRLWRISFSLAKNGTGIDYNITFVEVGGTAAFTFGATVASQTLNSCSQVVVGSPSSDSAVAFGHVTVDSAITTVFDLASQYTGYNTEGPTARISRLCSEESVTYYRYGNRSTTPPMGAQTADTLITLLRAAEDVEQGILFEPRDQLALAYKPRDTMQATPAGLTLDYSLGHLSSLDPTEDDQATANDVTIERYLGSFYKVTLDTGTLSTQSPPNGVGRYATTTTLALATDDYLSALAYWRLAVGTLDEPRYPTIGAQLARATFTGSTTRRTGALNLDIGDVVEVDNPPTWLPPYAILQRIEGTTETLSQFLYSIDYTCSPAALWTYGGVYDDPTGRTRYSSGVSTLSALAASGATSFSVATPSGPLWTTAAGDFPFQAVVSGEVVTVTNITGSSSPQTFTVTRSVNGIVKAQASGASIDVYTPSYYNL